MTYDPIEQRGDYKGFTLYREPTHNLWHIKCADGSVLPRELDQKYTEQRMVKSFIDSYIVRKAKAKLEDAN